MSWLKNNSYIVEGNEDHVKVNPWSLMVRNFSPSAEEKVVRYECIVAGLRYHDIRRSFNLSLAEGKYVLSPPIATYTPVYIFVVLMKPLISTL